MWPLRSVFVICALMALLAGGANAAVTSCTGATGTYNTVNTAAGASDACACVDGYVAADGTTTTGDTTLDCTKCAAGYYLSAASGGNGDHSAATCTQAETNKYHAGGADITTASVQSATDCPNNSGSVAGSDALADCKVSPGYYLKKADAADVSNIEIAQAAEDHYATGGTPVTSGTADTAVDHGTSSKVYFTCPFSGHSHKGAETIEDCAPSCPANSIPFLGECHCRAGFYGDLQGSDTACTACPENAESSPGQNEAATKCYCKEGFYGNLQGSDTTCTACPDNSESSPGSDPTSGADNSALSDCKVKPGYYLKSAKTGTSGDANELFGVIEQAAANHYAIGGTAVDGTADVAAAPGTAGKVYFTCPVKTNSAVGSSVVTDCYLDPGYYLSNPDLLAYARSLRNFYTPGGSSYSDEEEAETPKACPYAGTSAVGSDAIADCTPKCGTGTAVASSGTCVCKAGYTGSPTPEGSTPNGGCSAQLCKANEFVKSNACTACPSGKTNVAGDDASGIDTECDSPASPAASADADVAAAVSAAHDLAPDASRMVMISLVSAVALFL